MVKNHSLIFVRKVARLLVTAFIDLLYADYYTDYYVLIDWLIDNTAEEAIRSIIKLFCNWLQYQK